MRDLAEANAAAINNDDRNQPPEPKKTKRVRRRSYQTECQSLEKSAAAVQVRIGTALKLLDSLEKGPSQGVVLIAVSDLLRECLD